MRKGVKVLLFIGLTLFVLIALCMYSAGVYILIEGVIGTLKDFNVLSLVAWTGLAFLYVYIAVHGSQTIISLYKSIWNG